MIVGLPFSPSRVHHLSKPSLIDGVDLLPCSSKVITKEGMQVALGSVDKMLTLVYKNVKACYSFLSAISGILLLSALEHRKSTKRYLALVDKSWNKKNLSETIVGVL
jgi:hypothetical protein